MSILKELSTYSPPVEASDKNEKYEDLLESIEELHERWSLFSRKGSDSSKDGAKTTLKDPTKQLSMAKIHTVMLSPSDKSFGLKDKVFGIRNEDPIVAFMLDIMGVPMDGSPIRIRSGFMQYDQRSKMLFIARFKSDLPGERKHSLTQSKESK